MTDEFQTRADIEKLFQLIYSLEVNGSSDEESSYDGGDSGQITGNYYTKEEIDQLLEGITSKQCCDSKSNTLYALEDYTETSDDFYYLFRGDCWTVNNNFECSVSVTSETDTDLYLKGTFRTQQDLVGLYWTSQDEIKHPYISYGRVIDYNNVTLDFDFEMSGCSQFSSGLPSITIIKNDGSTYYFTVSRYITGSHFHLDFDNLVLQAGNTYIDSDGNPVTVDEDTSVEPTDIKSIMFAIVPTNYSASNVMRITENIDFYVSITNIEVTGGYIKREHLPLEPHKYRLCEGYDDFYNLNPRRVCKEMRKLGYTGWLDLYIGASHYYEKYGTVGDHIDVLDFDHRRTEKMVLDPTQPLNKAFAKWLDCYARELKANGTENLVISVSMENLQCPTSWRQKTPRGDYAMTGWVPSTFFYSPCNDEPVEYMKSVSEACLDIVVDNGMQPILQMGEAWWWWQESYKPVDEHGVPIIEDWQPPCFYDDATQTKYSQKFGRSLPVYTTSWDTSYDGDTVAWLNGQLANYVDELRTVIKSPRYENGLYMALFFPPSVIDVDRVPVLMRDVNFIKSAYSPTKLDVLQVEDYDWVTGNPLEPETKERDRSHHSEAYNIGEQLGFTKDKQHYFGGFVQYEENAVEFWRLIKKAMDDAIDKGFAEVFVWAGSQVRRDKKIIGYDDLEAVQTIYERVEEYESTMYNRIKYLRLILAKLKELSGNE